MDLIPRHHQYRRRARPTKFPMLDVTLAVAPDGVIVYDRNNTVEPDPQHMTYVEFSAWMRDQLNANRPKGDRP